MHVGAQEGELWDAYYTGAAKLQANGFFYAAAPQVARQYLDIEQTPCVFVYKEGLQYYFYSKCYIEHFCYWCNKLKHDS